MTDAFTWSQLGIIISGIGLVLTAWKLRQVDKERYEKAIAQVSKELGDFKLHVALMHPTSTELSSLRADLMGALNRLTERIDRLLERSE